MPTQPEPRMTTIAAAAVGVVLGAAGHSAITPSPTKPTDHDGVTRAYLTTVIDNQQTEFERLAEILERLPAPAPATTAVRPRPR